MNEITSNISLIRQLAVNNDTSRLARCLDTQMKDGVNSCWYGHDAESVLSVLAKAVYVRRRVENDGLSVNSAIRELGARMRSLSG